VSTEDKVKENLKEVLVPQAMRSVMQLNLLRNFEIKDSRMKVTLSAAAISPQVQESLTSQVQAKLQDLDGIGGIAVSFDESTPKDINRVGKVIAVMSGKGGVGKSLVAGLMATALARRGNEVGVLDADITGPSIPKMFGITARPGGSESGILPVLSRSGIPIMSINLLLPNEDDAVIWRGPIIGKSIQQFWEEVLWGKLDYLIVDLPPGTADAPLTVMQSLPLSGVIIVFSPQELALMVVRKAVKMARESMNIPVLGVVENMSYFVLPETGKRIEIFGKSKGGEMAKVAGAPLLGQLPIDPDLARLCDEGNIESYDSDVFKDFQEATARILSPAR